jgi:protein ImuB
MVMSSRAVHQGSRPADDALAASSSKGRKPELLLPSVPASPAAVIEARELWVGVHLPQLRSISGETPGEAHRNRRLLERLATAARHFTPRVSLALPDGLLLEVKGSLRLFGGVAALCDRIEESHRSMQVRSRMAMAPTPEAALACARMGDRMLITNPALLAGSVALLPLVALRWPAGILGRLSKIGVRSVGQALRLPRHGFARRFGAAQLASLDRLMGHVADPRTTFHPHERFFRRRELPCETGDRAVILRTLEPLLEELEGFLQSRQGGITRLQCRFRHRRAEPTSSLLSLAAPTADGAWLTSLLGERLARLALPEPARCCELRTDAVVSLRPICGQAWQPGEHGGERGVEAVHLLERLRARLEGGAVYGLRLTGDHHPERTWRRVEPGTAADTPRLESGPRPLWLLSPPQLLSEEAGFPCSSGVLRLRRDTERLESAWWDAQVARDYYTAIDSRGARLWIFRERTAPHRWFLHGMFG